MGNIREMSEFFKLLGDPTRLSILVHLYICNELCVSEIAKAVNLKQPTVSQQLGKLNSGNLVNEQRRGQWVYFSINKDYMPFIKDVLERTTLT